MSKEPKPEAGGASTTIDHKTLSATYKKNGSFDNKRKILLQDFKKSQTHSNLLLKLKVMVESKIRNDPSILLKNKGKIAALIQGEVINGNSSGSSILSIVDKDIQEKIIDSPGFHQELKVELKDIRRKLLGVTDEDYAKQLENERVQKAEEDARKERERAERDLAYKNNFKVKQLSFPAKIVKPPRFSFHPKNHREDDIDNYRGSNGMSGQLRY
ncbi:hypothetical protein METBIDRAFT_37988 [Metschnikowia bicuspidata var. bicuspidata NRRL YB-4993]|uniref:BOD1/SHG1 domain-containing protein n=1 Tax=Metschnikowia bicuspidata var. bicuspidata NRRL YB-4993 TaxID=869754 RepID=A0A1A0HKY9_9ASCO|nr:hypothetical protein METBIDRAFT_37988 [Metschnikowia bicuspidata var. bicuspidata NRRL YB-4993]OBA24473.1 hypothetical protein METBIDRAFT_37988 [Metschnikowia bicuspidata var. bicuspidata NRRL YB-4993]